ncbi:CRISPR-associated protein Cas1 [Coriobacterium glomerans PW2]|uniref:CRISPR-associated endonuclease Cas1 n=1 Tax=Coriobacterium glomerans (strain ATCC 49209 / DSM 20642 / JCM 10262 / PW2) TaxID=700015 RepID=F2NB83_CORGP|nr:type II CRISPR-associated endonuclease Cas1 [Coriobacterium glomerans]AEB07834.1 CRISPR-associated protein Cas1 [Coriobacterium glomerans PW2]
MAFRNVLIESACKCTYQGGYLVVRKEDDAAKIHLSEISSVTLQSTQVFVSAYLLSELAKAKITFVISDEKRNPVGQYLPIYGAHNTSKRIGEQISWEEPIKKRVWQRVVRDKITNQARLLEIRGRSEEAGRIGAIVSDVRSGDTTNREAYAARCYFQSLFGDSFSRDDDLAINAALNYGYAIILSAVNREIVSRGYLTQLGVCHRNEYNQFNLSCDLMEPFRPIVDRIVFDNVQDDFTRNDRRLLVDLMNGCIAYRDGTYKTSSVISLYVQDCLNALNKRLAIDEIDPFDIV